MSHYFGSGVSDRIKGFLDIFLRRIFGRTGSCQIEGSDFWPSWFWIFGPVRICGTKGRKRIRVVAATGWLGLAFARAFAFAPFAWRPGLRALAHCCLGKVSLSHGPIRSGSSGSDRGRPVSWHPDPSRHFRAAVLHEPSGRPVSVFSVPGFSCSGFQITGWWEISFHSRSGRSMPWSSSMSLRQ